MRVVIIGAGAIGLSVAYSLSKDDTVDVCVLDRVGVGTQCSSGNAGWILPGHGAPVPAPGVVGFTARSLGRPASPVYLKPSIDFGYASWLLRFWRSCSPGKYAEGKRAIGSLGHSTKFLFDELGELASFERQDTGSLHVYRSRDEAEHHCEEARMDLAEHGMAEEVRFVSKDELLDLEPSLSDSVVAGFLIPSDFHVEPRSFTKALATAVTKFGGTISTGVEARRFDTRQGRVERLHTSEGTVGGDVFVVAGGAWSHALCHSLGVTIPLQAGKGYSFAVELDPGVSRVVELGDAKAALVPHGSLVRVAGTMELSGFNLNLDLRRLQAVIDAARPLFRNWPGGAGKVDGVLEPWVGMRPMTPDGLPIIDRLPGYENVFIATGHAMEGMSLSLGTGRALSDLILGTGDGSLLEPFRAKRFMQWQGRRIAKRRVLRSVGV